jgi:hypothetical protein
LSDGEDTTGIRGVEDILDDSFGSTQTKKKITKKKSSSNLPGFQTASSVLSNNNNLKRSGTDNKWDRLQELEEQEQMLTKSNLKSVKTRLAESMSQKKFKSE